MNVHSPYRILAALLASLALAPVVRAQAPAPAPRAALRREGSFTYRDTRLAKKTYKRGWQLYVSSERAQNFDFGPARDPKFGKEYPLRLQVKCTTDEPGRDSDRRFVIHALAARDEPLARLVGSVMARLYWFGQDYLGVGPTGSQYVNVWLSRDGEPGAEEFQRHIYLYAIDQARAPAEWVRELAHEYSHAYIPQLGEYTAPEKWASGYLGERLFLKWMLADNAQGDVWSEPIDGEAYEARQVAPLREKALNLGPSSPLIEKKDAEGMDFFIGQLLAIEAAHGPEFIGQLLARFLSPRPQNLPLNLISTIRELKPAFYPLYPAGFIPRESKVEPGAPGGVRRVAKAASWVYLPGGDWLVVLSGQVPPGTTVALDGTEMKRGNSPLPGGLAWETAVLSAGGGWRRLEITAPAGQPVELRSIYVSRRGALSPAALPVPGAPAAPAAAPAAGAAG